MDRILAAFDLDGVLVDSEDIKIRSWADAVDSVLNPPSQLLIELDGYNRRNRGI